MGRVALVCMPFGPPDRPSIALGILAASLRQRNIRCDVFYFNLDYCKEIDRYVLLQIINGNSHPFELVGEFIFSHLVDSSSPEKFIEEILHRPYSRSVDVKRLSSSVQKAKAASGDFVDRCLSSTDWGQFSVVGFTTTFQQQAASLALAKKIKALNPHTRIVFGGSNCHGEMGRGLLNAFEFIDGVCIGEGDDEFCQLVSMDFCQWSQLRNFEVRPLPAPRKSGQVLSERVVGLGEDAPGVKLVDLNLVPSPDYADFFEQISRLGDQYDFMPRLMIETSRGCWWGKKHHCAFCGLNTEMMEFRRKSPEIALQQIGNLIERYSASADVVSFVDNIIPNDYYKTFIPKLNNVRRGKEFFYEIKINIRDQQMRLLAENGVRHLQPGIESFSNRLLRAMDKGSSRIQSVAFLKSARQHGIVSYWNILTGVPSESMADYEDYPDLFAKLHHLTPPPGIGRIRIDRFSPYYFRALEFGICKLEPYPAYRHVFGDLSEENRRKIAYYYKGEIPLGVSASDLESVLQPAIDRWQLLAATSVLVAMDFGDGAVIFDTRGTEEEWRAYVIKKVEWTILKTLCEECGESQVAEQLLRSGLNAESIIEKWEKAGVVLRDEGKIISLFNEWKSGFYVTADQATAMQNVIARQTKTDLCKETMMRLPFA